MKTKNALIYLRVASPLKTDEYIKEQAKLCEKFCIQHNLAYGDGLCFVGGGNKMNLLLAASMSDSKNNPDVIVVPSFARISRNKADVQEFVNTLKAAGVTVYSATETTSL